MRKSESCYPCQFTYYGAIVQLVRTPACHAGGRGFDTHSSRHRSLVQLRRTTDSKSGMLFRYGGLIPSTPAIFSNARIAQWQCSCFVSSWLWVQLLLLAPLNRALLRLRHIVYSGPVKGLFMPVSRSLRMGTHPPTQVQLLPVYRHLLLWSGGRVA